MDFFSCYPHDLLTKPMQLANELITQHHEPCVVPLDLGQPVVLILAKPVRPDLLEGHFRAAMWTKPVLPVLVLCTHSKAFNILSARSWTSGILSGDSHLENISTNFSKGTGCFCLLAQTNMSAWTSSTCTW
jgi:hypothetical protein